MGNEQKETKEEETVENNEEVIKRLETSTKRLEEANAKLAKDRAEFEMRKVEAQLGGKSEAGQPPVEKTWQQKVEEDLQSVIPDEYLPRSFRRKK